MVSCLIIILEAKASYIHSHIIAGIFVYMIISTLYKLILSLVRRSMHIKQQRQYLSTARKAPDLLLCKPYSLFLNQWFNHAHCSSTVHPCSYTFSRTRDIANSSYSTNWVTSDHSSFWQIILPMCNNRIPIYPEFC